MRALTDGLWSALAGWLADSPRVVALIQRVAARTPYFDIYGPGGTLYMRRWWLMPRWCLRFDPLLGYPMPKPWMPFSVRVHHIVRPDADRHLHDHPFNFRTLLLQGSYIEQTEGGRFKAVFAGDTYRSPAARFHRIDDVDREGVWSLFIMGRRVNDWGFLVDGHKVAWRQYLGGNHG